MHSKIDWLAKFEGLSLAGHNFVDGKKVATLGGTLCKRSPRDGSVLCDVASATAAQVDEAIASARRAYDDGRWSHLSPERRKQILLRLADLVDEHSEELALLECVDTGKPIAAALAFDVPHSARLIAYNAELADKHTSPVYSADKSNLSYQLRRPVGVVGAIIGWNFPLVLAASKIGPALAAGNTLVLKPSEFTCFTALRLAELAVEAGIPEGVLNVIVGDRQTGAHLAHHHDVGLLSFTGSSATGKRLLVASGESNMKRLLLECGGKAANIVFDDCPNLDEVAANVASRAFWNQGQVCTASSRFLVQEGVADRFIEAVLTHASRLKPGDPLDPTTQFGALVSSDHAEKVKAYIELGKGEGRYIAPCPQFEAPFETGYYVAPTLFTDVNPGARVSQEEIFGPVAVIMRFDSEAEAIAQANDTIYGLSTIVWTQSLQRAHAVSQGILSGTIAINATGAPAGGPTAGGLPIGGLKQSGLGIEGGVEGLEEYYTKTSVQIFV